MVQPAGASAATGSVCVAIRDKLRDRAMGKCEGKRKTVNGKWVGPGKRDRGNAAHAFPLPDCPFPTLRICLSPSSLWIEQGHSPPVPISRIELPIVQPARLPRPELDRGRDEAKAGPERRSRHLAPFEALLVLGDTRVQIAGAVHRPALSRGPCTDLAPAGTRGEIRVRFHIADRCHPSLDAHLTLQR